MGKRKCSARASFCAQVDIKFKGKGQIGNSISSGQAPTQLNLQPVKVKGHRNFIGPNNTGKIFANVIEEVGQILTSPTQL